MFVVFPRLYQNLRQCIIFRQIWTIRGSDSEVYPFSKCWRPLLWIFVIEHFDHLTCFVCVIEILPPHSKFHLNGTVCSWVIAKKVIFNEASISHFQFANFSIFVTFPSFEAKFVSACYMWWNSNNLRLGYGDILIFKMAAASYVAFSKFDIFII